jgi:hypothetical protein
MSGIISRELCAVVISTTRRTAARRRAAFRKPPEVDRKMNILSSFIDGGTGVKTVIYMTPPSSSDSWVSTAGYGVITATYDAHLTRSVMNVAIIQPTHFTTCMLSAFRYARRDKLLSTWAGALIYVLIVALL